MGLANISELLARQEAINRGETPPPRPIVGRDVLIQQMMAAPDSAFNSALLDQADAWLGGLGSNGRDVADIARAIGGVQTQYGTLNALPISVGDESGSPGTAYRLINNDPDGKGMWFTPLSRNADGTVTRGTPSYSLKDGGWGDFITAVAMMAPAVGGIVGAAGGAAAGAGGGAAAGGSGISLGGTGAMTTGEALGAAGGSGLTFGGTGALTAGEALGAAGGSGLSLSGLGAGIGSTLPAVGASTLSDAVANGIWDAAPAATETTAAPTGLSSADKAALYGNEGYGPGMTGAQNTAFNGVLDATGSTQLASLAGDAAGLPGMNGLTTAAQWLKDNPLLGKALFSAAGGLLGGASNAGAGAGAGAQVAGPAKTWSTPLQQGLLSTPTLHNPAALTAAGSAHDGAWRWMNRS